MILQAIESGVPEERIAKALNVTPKTIRDSKNRLSGICKEAIEPLKDKPIAEMTLRALKKVKPYRQIEIAGLMTMSNTFTPSYAKALLAATPAEQLLEPPKPDARPEQIAMLEAEMRTVERDFVVLEESYSRDTLNLRVSRVSLKTLLQNGRVSHYLTQKHPEIEAQLRKVCRAELPRGVRASHPDRAVCRRESCTATGDARVDRSRPVGRMESLAKSVALPEPTIDDANFGFGRGENRGNTFRETATDRERRR